MHDSVNRGELNRGKLAELLSTRQQPRVERGRCRFMHESLIIKTLIRSNGWAGEATGERHNSMPKAANWGKSA